MSTANERTYDVEGMSCAHCELSVREEVQGVAGVMCVRVDHTTGRVVVAGEKVDDGAVRAAVAEAGYRVTS